MTLFSQLVAWENYLSEDLVGAETEELRAETLLKRTEAVFIAGFESDLKSGKVTAAKSAAKSDPEVQKASEAYMTAYFHRKALSMKLEGTGRLSSFVSRELSRRIGREPVQRRSDRLTP
jgi:hypothetical protein